MVPWRNVINWPKRQARNTRNAPKWNVRDADARNLLSGPMLAGGSAADWPIPRCAGEKRGLHLSREKGWAAAAEMLSGFWQRTWVKTLNVAGPRQFGGARVLLAFCRQHLERESLLGTASTGRVPASGSGSGVVVIGLIHVPPRHIRSLPASRA